MSKKMNSIHLTSFLGRLQSETPEAVELAKETAKKANQHLKSYRYDTNEVGLLLGNVQSGKTSQLFSVIADAADKGFKIFVLLTSDNVTLQEQTFTRALRLLDTFNVCGENDFLRLKEVGLRKPILVVIKKNSNILNSWRNNLSSLGYCKDQAIFIVDDEADSASLNTKINKKQISAIHNHLNQMRKLANGSIFLQVTATPQALLLQELSSSKIAQKPQFVHYIEPGKGYLGGEFFYSEPKSYAIRFTKEDELDSLRNEESCIPEGLKESLFSFLIVGAHLFSNRQFMTSLLS